MMHDDEDRSFDAILLPKQHLAGFVDDFGLNRSETTYEQVTLWDVLLNYQCTSL
jgi:hypothetical protein